MKAGATRTTTLPELNSSEPETLPWSGVVQTDLRYTESSVAYGANTTYSSAPSGLGRAFKPMTWEMWKHEHREVISKRRAASKRARAARKKQRRGK